MSTPSAVSEQILSPRHRLGPRLGYWPVLGLGLWLTWFVLKPHVSVLGGAVSAGHVLTVVGVLSACGLAAWLESYLYYAGRVRAQRVLFAVLAAALPLAVLSLLVSIDFVIQRRTTYSGDVLLVGGIGCAWFLFAWAGSVLILLLDMGVSVFLSTFRNRVRALVLVLLALGCAASVVLAPRLFGLLSARGGPGVWGASHYLDFFAARFVSVPGAAELTRGSSPGALFVSTVILLVALPAVASATAKFAGLVVERIYPLLFAFDAVARGDRSTRVEEGGSDEFRQLASRFNRMVQSLAMAERMERAFGTYVSTQLLERIRAQQGEATVMGSTRQATVFFADIRGFTSMSETLPAEAVVQVLNVFFERAVEIINAHDGYLNKFLGDALMVVFNGPLEQVDHRARALRCAMALSSAVAELNEQRAFPFVGQIAVGVGVASGTMVCGNVGSNTRMEYTVIGDVVNTASRLCSKAPGGEVWMTADMASALPPGCLTRPLAPLQVKGKQAPLEVVAWSIAARGEEA